MMPMNDVAVFQSIPLSTSFGCCTGVIVEVNDKGNVFVDYPENSGKPVLAKIITNVPFESLLEAELKIPVLIIFERDDPTLPIIVGIIKDSVQKPIGHEQQEEVIKRPEDGLIDGKKIIFDAEDEIVLRCGKSAVILKKNGKVIIKGEKIISRSSSTHKIKGSSVTIN